MTEDPKQVRVEFRHAFGPSAGITVDPSMFDRLEAMRQLMLDMVQSDQRELERLRVKALDIWMDELGILHIGNPKNTGPWVDPVALFQLGLPISNITRFQMDVKVGQPARDKTDFSTTLQYRSLSKLSKPEVDRTRLSIVPSASGTLAAAAGTADSRSQKPRPTSASSPSSSGP